MRLTLRQLEIFRAIAHTGSTTAAAQSVPLSQSATSAALLELERVLGARLFDRIGKRLLLNDNGRALLPTALAVLDGARHLEAAFASADGSSFVDLRLSASTTIGNYILPPVLARYRELCPAARLELKIGNTRTVGPQNLHRLPLAADRGHHLLHARVFGAGVGVQLPQHRCAR